MKPREKKPETVFRIIDREGGWPCGSYSRACCGEYDFNSIREAREANCHGMFKNKEKYQIAKYRVTYKLIDEDCDIFLEPTPMTIDEKFFWAVALAVFGCLWSKVFTWLGEVI